jgi:hypothetical protein
VIHVDLARPSCCPLKLSVPWICFATASFVTLLSLPKLFFVFLTQSRPSLHLVSYIESKPPGDTTTTLTNFHFVTKSIFPRSKRACAKYKTVTMVSKIVRVLQNQRLHRTTNAILSPAALKQNGHRSIRTRITRCLQHTKQINP